MISSIRDEFIGETLEIHKSNNRSLMGMKGKIIDETRDTFKILVDRGKFRELKIIMKKNNIFRIDKMLIDGNKIIKSTEDRIKLKDKK